MTRTAIIAAMPGELKALVQCWKHRRSAGVDVWAHRDDNLWVAACAGAGQTAAVRAFAELEKDSPIDLVFSVGWAGALRGEYTAGQAYNVAGVIDIRTGERFRCDAGSGDVWLATSPRVADEDEKRRLAATYGAGLVDMEAAAVARLAAMRSIPFYCIKGVSDSLDAQMPDFNRFLDEDGRLKTASLIVFALLHPHYWPALIAMGENSRKAAKSISTSMLDFLR